MKNFREISKLIDHTLLNPSATGTDIKKLCEEAVKFGFFSVCIHPFFINTARKILSGSGVKISTVIGFPLGMTASHVKIFEAMEAVLMGADELDIVINPALVKAGEWKAVKKEISDIISATPGITHKIIIETHYLTNEEKTRASLSVLEAGAEFVKTSTGFAPSGAAVGDIAMIKATTGGKIGIKAAGGIRSLKDTLCFIEAGATRIGTSSGVDIMNEIFSKS